MKRIDFILRILLLSSFNLFAEYAGAATTCPEGSTCYNCGSDCLAYLSNSGEQLNIIGSGEMTSTPWTSFSDYQKNIKSVVIQGNTKDEQGNILSSGITSIAKNAFYNMDGVKNVSIPDSVTTIGAYAFRAMSGMKDGLVIPDSVVTIEAGAFAYADFIKNLIIPDSVTDIGDSAFAAMSGSESIVIGNSVENMGSGVFQNSPYKEIYCPMSKYAMCQQALSDSGKTQQEINKMLKTYTKEGNRYISDGVKYQNLSDMQEEAKAVKRIYTVNEANQLSGKKNKLILRYK